QGGLFAPWVEPIFLSSIVVSADPRSDGPGPLSSSLSRAIPGRAALALATTNHVPPSSSGRPPPGDAQPAAAGAGSPLTSPLPEVKEAMRVFVTEVTFDKSKAQSEQRACEEGVSCSAASGAGAADPRLSTAPTAPAAPAATAVGGEKYSKICGDHNNHGNSTNNGSISSSRGASGSASASKDARPRRDRKLKRAVPSGTSLNWIEGLGTGRGAGPGGGDATRVQAEVTLSATGRMQGAVSKGVLTLRTRSRLCRARLLEAAELVARAYPPRGPPLCD
ncbi:unnamed protein product, partial [Hapterophycus canaliculatus]